MRTDFNIFMHYFCIVAQLKSFTKAAQQLSLSPSALSQAIQQLEKQLGLKLLHRSTRSLSLTEAGQRLYTKIQPALAEIQHTIEEVKQQYEQPSGSVKIMTSYIAWKVLISPLIEQFSKAYPAIGLDIQIDEGLSNLVLDGYDIGIRSTRTLIQSMVAVPIGKPIESKIVASPKYLNDFGIPKMPEDIYHHQCIGYRFTTSHQLYPWVFTRNNQSITLHPNHRFIVNNEIALIELALLHKGLAYVFENETVIQAVTNNQLITILTDWQTNNSQYYLYYQNRQFIPARIRAFIDFIKTNH